MSPQEWQAALQELLVEEKALMRARDAFVAKRRRLPLTAVTQEYRFDGPDGRVSLLDLFAGRRQLIVYRAFFEHGVHGWPDHACIGCSLGADQVSHQAHLNARDTTLVYASRAPQADVARLKSRMGWNHIAWVSLTDGIDADFGVDEWHGHNAFIRDGEQIYRTYFINGRGDEAMGTVWSYLDMTALGRQEEWEKSPEGYPQSPRHKWWNWHDSYVPSAAPDPEWDKVSAAGEAVFREDSDQQHDQRKSNRGARFSRTEITALFTAPGSRNLLGSFCSTSTGAPHPSGMVAMYLLMSLFHLKPWLRLFWTISD